MNEYYEKLMDLKGAQELQALIKKWDVLSDNISKRSFDAPILLPDIFMYTCPGYGNTSVLSLLSDYIDSKGNLMGFYGDVKFFEFKLEYCRPSENFNELYRFIESVQAAAGFRNEFKGIIRINIDEWVKHHTEKHFLDFLQLIDANTEHWLVIFTLSDKTENSDTQAMEGLISMYLRIEKVTIHMPETEELVEYACQQLAKYGFTTDDGAKEVLVESIAVLRKNKYFYGMNTVRDLCSDIVYSLFSREAIEYKVITADMLKEFSKDSAYIKRTVTKLKKTETIGF